MSDAAPIDDSPPISIGGVIAHFRLLARLGAGGMGVVYRAVDTKLGREVALKVIHPRVAQDADRRRRFLREGRLAAHLTHPCIATVYEVGEAEGRVYIAMELVAGDTLNTLVKPGRPLPWGDALGIIHEVLRGLHKAHEVGVIHRDLKPDNIVVGQDGIVKVLDFGVAKRLETSELDFSTDVKTQHGSLVGTPAYMSPEQAAGKEVDARSDLFSVGVVLYEMLTGQLPFKGETWQETIIAINRDDMPPISDLTPDVPPEIDDIIRRCLAKKPKDRYPTCKELLDDISAFVVGNVTGTFPPAGVAGILQGASRSNISDIRSRRPPPHSRARMLIVVGVAAAITVAIGLFFMSPQEDAPRTPEPAPSTPPVPTVTVQPTAVPTPAPAPSAPATSPSASSQRPTPAPQPAKPKPMPKPNPVLGF